MSSLALYRKYRSTSLDDVVGQDHIVEPLKHAIANKHIKHAYLFSGSHGIGKTSVARIFAHEINGFTYDHSNKIDIIEIDGASNRKIDEIRNLKEKIHIAPVEGQYKVYIIDEVHMLTREAFNALLKTLEEPPAHAVFILATTEPHKLPATIVSRTQRHNFKPAHENMIIELLTDIAKQETITYEDGVLEHIAKRSNNSYRDSLSLLDQLSNGNSADTLTVEYIQLALGIIQDERFESVIAALDSEDQAAVAAEIEGIVMQGVTPETIAKQLAEHIISHAPQYSAVAKELLQLKRFDDMHLGLLLILTSTVAAVKPERGAQDVVQDPARKSTAPHESSSNSQPAKPVAEKTTPVDPPVATKEPKQAPMPEPASAPENSETSTEAQKTPPEQEPDKSEDAQTSATSKADGNWDALLAEAKKDKLKIYPILRLAQPVLTDGVLTAVEVKFPFHQTKLSEAECANELKNLTSSIYGASDVSVAIASSKEGSSTSSVEQSVQLSEVQQVDADNSSYDNIVDIMGGAEAVEI